MSVSALLAGLASATALALWSRAGPRRWPGRREDTRDAVRTTAPGFRHPTRAASSLTARLASAVAGAGAGLLLGGRLGWLLAVVAGAGAWWVVGRAEPIDRRRRRRRLEEDLPHLVELMAACLASGATPEAALALSAEAIAGPLADELAGVAGRLRLGVDPVRVWRGLADHPELGALGRTVARALDSGAPAQHALVRLADDLRREGRSRAEARARAVGVRAALPLGACLLPSFVLVGVVPLVVGALGSLLAP